MKSKHLLLTLFLSLFFLTKTVLASIPEGKQVVLIFVGDIVAPVFVPIPEPTTTSPKKPILVNTLDSTTYSDTTNIIIKGESGASIYVNGTFAGVIDGSREVILSLNTSGALGDKVFSITLKDKAGNSSDPLQITITKIDDPKYTLEYKGLAFYHQDKLPEDYRLNMLTDSTFNALTQTKKLQVANKLLSTLFFGYPQDILLEKIASGNFISTVYAELKEEKTDKEWLETYIKDEDFFERRTYNEQEGVDILSRFYAMKYLDKYFLDNWTAYILTQTIMFSPAYELDTSHASNIENVYSRIVSMLHVDSGMRYITYVHMMSEDNWRRFRSPEDNGREMLELFHLDEDDAHVPIAGQALQNWRLDSDSDTLVVGLNTNTQPLRLFDTILYNGDDFYRELVKSSLFTKGVVTRLVDFFFPEEESNKKSQIVTSIVASSPETWQDIMLQIVFSSDYLLTSSRTKSAEELFFSLAKKIDFKHRVSTFHTFKDALENMHQASMKYKLGKYTQVPLDTFSFSTYHKYIRERMFLRKSASDDYTEWSREGWSEAFIANNLFNFDESSATQTLESLVTYLFNTIISRNPTSAELALFHKHMTFTQNNALRFDYPFDIFRTENDSSLQIVLRERYKRNITYIVLDYLSRLTETYTHIKVR